MFDSTFCCVHFSTFTCECVRLSAKFFPPIDPGFWVVSEDEVSDLESDKSVAGSSEVDEVSDEISEEASEQGSEEGSEEASQEESVASEEESLESEEVSEEESDNDVEVMEILEKVEIQNLNQRQTDNIVQAQKDNVTNDKTIVENGKAEKTVSSATGSVETVCMKIG